MIKRNSPTKSNVYVYIHSYVQYVNMGLQCVKDIIYLIINSVLRRLFVNSVH